jgi:hypothetical protein
MNHPRERAPIFERQCQVRKGGQPLIGAENGWQDGRKCNGSLEDVFEVGCVGEIYIMPIIYVLVEIFKGPPKSRAEQKQLAK